MRRIILTCVTVLGLLSCAFSASATTIYGTAYTGPEGPASLYTIDATTGAATLVGVTGYNRVGAIDFDPLNGMLYGIGVNPISGNFDLITINTTTGAATQVGSLGIASFPGHAFFDMSFRSDGTLYTIGWTTDTTLSIYTINVGTGAPTFVGDTGTFPNGNALAFDPSNTLYTVNQSNVQTIDQGTGAPTTVADATYPSSVGSPRANAMDYDLTTNTLYASVVHGSGVTAFNFLATIDVSTGIVSEVGPTMTGLDGLAVLPEQSAAVPDAMSTLWLALPLCGLFVFKRLQRA